MDSIGIVSDIFSLKGKVAIVTGAGQGLGFGIAEAYAQFGANVVIIDINEKKAEEVSSHLKNYGINSISIRCDVTNQEAVNNAIKTTVEVFGRIDILAAVAGIGDRNPAEKMDIEQWNRVIDINLKGVWLFDQAVGKQMITQGDGGTIVNMASIAGLVGLTTGNANYSASKGGVIALTRDLAVEWAKYNIRVNAIAPAQFKTLLVEKLIESKPETESYFIENIPLRRLGDIWEIVGAAIFLSSRASTMVTGTILNVDGGYTAQ